jgi:epoxyqueuosine reductase
MLGWGRMQRLEQRIRAAARRLGFSRCGFARIQAPPHGDFVRRWLHAGHAAEMSYIGRGLAKRLAPELVLPGARSVISVGVPYAPPPLPAVDWRRELRGRIAAYAYGLDYHETVGRQLEDLAAYCRELRPRTVALAYVDTGPILEREWAAAAGVGWFGKNTNLLHTEEGSWFFLGEILTDLELEPDAPVEDRCGTCTRCLDLCPTAALKPGYVLDARLCISYLTIEHRGAIPRALRAGIGNWIFGCDVCQEVCPWNDRFTRRHGVPDTDAFCPPLPELLTLDDEQFRRRFRHSAVRRAKRDGFVRNVAVALGNTQNPAAVATLDGALRADPAAVVRAHAAWGLGNIDDVAARRALEGARACEADPAVRAEIDASLLRLQG